MRAEEGASRSSATYSSARSAVFSAWRFMKNAWCASSATCFSVAWSIAAECCVAMILWLPMCSSSDSVLSMRAWRFGSAMRESSSARVRAVRSALPAAN